MPRSTQRPFQRFSFMIPKEASSFIRIVSNLVLHDAMGCALHTPVGLFGIVVSSGHFFGLRSVRVWITVIPAENSVLVGNGPEAREWVLFEIVQEHAFLTFHGVCARSTGAQMILSPVTAPGTNALNRMDSTSHPGENSEC